MLDLGLASSNKSLLWICDNCIPNSILQILCKATFWGSFSAHYTKSVTAPVLIWREILLMLKNNQKFLAVNIMFLTGLLWFHHCLHVHGRHWCPRPKLCLPNSGLEEELWGSNDNCSLDYSFNSSTAFVCCLFAE